MSALLDDSAAGADSTYSSIQEYDFGKILAQGQTLTHEFILRNPTERPVRLIGGTAFTPCCSSIGTLPQSIPPKCEVRIPVTFKPVSGSGVKRVAFAVETDDPAHPARTFGLSARLISVWEIEQLTDASTSLPLGQSGKQEFRLTARRKGTAGLGLPETISATPPLAAAFREEVPAKTDSEGLIERIREVVVTIPAERQPGRRRGEVIFGWPDGHTRRRTIAWEVRPRLMISPSGLVLSRSSQPVEQTVVVSSDGRPFHVVKVTSPLLAGPVEHSRQAGIRQRLNLRLDLSRTPAERAVDVRIDTDHPDQPTAILSVLVLSGSKGQKP